MSKLAKQHRKKVAARNQKLAHTNGTSMSELTLAVHMGSGKAANMYLDRMCKKRKKLKGEKSTIEYRMKHK